MSEMSLREKIAKIFFEYDGIDANKYEVADNILALLPEPVKTLGEQEVIDILKELRAKDCAFNPSLYEVHQTAKALSGRIRKEEKQEKEVDGGRPIRLIKPEKTYFTSNAQYYTREDYVRGWNEACDEWIAYEKGMENKQEPKEYCSCYYSDKLDNGRNLCLHCNKMIEPKPNCDCISTPEQFINSGIKYFCPNCGRLRTEPKPVEPKIEELPESGLSYHPEDIILVSKLNEVVRKINGL